MPADEWARWPEPHLAMFGASCRLVSTYAVARELGLSLVNTEALLRSWGVPWIVAGNRRLVNLFALEVTAHLKTLPAPIAECLLSDPAFLVTFLERLGDLYKGHRRESLTRYFREMAKTLRKRPYKQRTLMAELKRPPEERPVPLRRALRQKSEKKSDSLVDNSGQPE